MGKTYKTSDEMDEKMPKEKKGLKKPMKSYKSKIKARVGKKLNLKRY